MTCALRPDQLEIGLDHRRAAQRHRRIALGVEPARELVSLRRGRPLDPLDPPDRRAGRRPTAPAPSAPAGAPAPRDRAARTRPPGRRAPRSAAGRAARDSHADRAVAVRRPATIDTPRSARGSSGRGCTTFRRRGAGARLHAAARRQPRAKPAAAAAVARGERRDDRRPLLDRAAAERRQRDHHEHPERVVASTAPVAVGADRGRDRQQAPAAIVPPGRHESVRGSRAARAGRTCRSAARSRRPAAPVLGLPHLVDAVVGRSRTWQAVGLGRGLRGCFSLPGGSSGLGASPSPPCGGAASVDDRLRAGLLQPREVRESLPWLPRRRRAAEPPSNRSRLATDIRQVRPRVRPASHLPRSEPAALAAISASGSSRSIAHGANAPMISSHRPPARRRPARAALPGSAAPPSDSTATITNFERIRATSNSIARIAQIRRAGQTIPANTSGSISTIT